MSELSVKQNSGFFMRPYAFFHKTDGGRVRRAETIVAGQIYSMSKKENVCRFGYSTFMKKNNMAKSTVARSIKGLNEKGEIRRQRRGGKTSEYTYSGDFTPGHIRTENFFYTEKMTVFGVERYPTNAEVDVYSLIYTHTRDKKRGCFEGSKEIIAKILGMSEKTAERAIKALLAAGRIFRPKKGVNRHAGSLFVANMKWIRAQERALGKVEKKAKEQRSQEIIAADARADRDRFYAERQREAQAKADRYLARANTDPRFKPTQKELRGLEFKLANAELHNPSLLPALLQRQKELRAQRAEILKGRGIELWQLNAKSFCRCRECMDTGYKSNGRGCSCYSPPN